MTKILVHIVYQNLSLSNVDILIQGRAVCYYFWTPGYDMEKHAIKLHSNRLVKKLTLLLMSVPFNTELFHSETEHVGE